MSRFWRLLEAWAKVVLTPTRFESKRTVAVLGSWIVDRDSGDRDSGDRNFGDRDSVVLGIVQCSCSWISSAPMAYLPIVL